MWKLVHFSSVMLIAAATPALAQTAADRQAEALRQTRELQEAAAAQLREARYQIGQMERLLEGASSTARR